jgi:hypothetical protein
MMRMPKTSVRLPDGSYAQIVEWFDTDAFQAIFCFEPHVPAVQVKSKTWRPQVHRREGSKGCGTSSAGTNSCSR